MEFPQITGDNDQAPASRMTGDQDIISAYGESLALEDCANITGMRRSFGSKRQDFQSGGKSFDLNAFLRWPIGLCRAMKQLAQDDRRHAKPIGFSVEPCSQSRRLVSQYADTQVRIQHVAKHQKDSRSCVAG